MAITGAVRILKRAIADGVSTSFTFDLNTSPYIVGTASYDVGGIICNWFGGASASSHFPPPIGVNVVSGADSAELVSPVITVHVPVKPAGFHYEVVLDVLFA
jgi:hypothetical protein